MKNMTFILFFSIVIIIYGLLNFYIVKRGLNLLPLNGMNIRQIFLWSVIIISITFPLGKVLERTWDSSVSDTVNLIGGLWLAVFNYLIFIFLLSDLVFLVFRMIDPVACRDFLDRNGLKVFYVILFLAVAITTSGYINARSVHVKKIDLKFNKKLENKESYKIAVFSDVHLGAIIGNEFLEKIVKKINREDVDLVLIPGDLVDGEMQSVYRKNLGKPLEKLKTEFGVYAINGNHEVMGNPELMARHFSQFGIKYLEDTSILINRDIWITGRQDYDAKRFEKEESIKLVDLYELVEKEKITIVMDHQPVRIAEAVLNQTDLLLCGHTHHGQLFPLNLITNAAFKVSWGLEKFDQTQVYVSCGVGSWGPPVRVGNRPEIVILTITSSDT